MGNPSVKLWLLIVVLLAAFIVGGSYFYAKVVKKPLISPPSTPALQTTQVSPGIRAAQDLADNYPQFVKKAFIQQQIQGTLKVVTENSWTLEAGGKSLTLSNTSGNNLRITKVPKVASPSAQSVSSVEIKSQDLKVGDLVSISQIIDWQTGKVTITGITVLPTR